MSFTPASSQPLGHRRLSQIAIVAAVGLSLGAPGALAQSSTATPSSGSPPAATATAVASSRPDVLPIVPPLPAEIAGPALAAPIIAPGTARPSPSTTPGQATAEPAPRSTNPPTQAAIAEPDPALAVIRAALAGPPRAKAVHSADWKALRAHYEQPAATLHWVARNGALTRRGTAVARTIADAGTWGLSQAAFELPTGTAADAKVRADAEVAIAAATLTYARHARGGRVDPENLSRYFDQKPPVLDPAAVLAAVTATEVPGEYLVGLHPKHPQFRLLRQALVKIRSGGAVAKTEPGDPGVKIPNGPTLRPGQDHPHVALLRTRLGVVGTGEAERYDAAVETAIKTFQSARGLTPDGLVGNGTRAALNGERSAERSPRRDEDRILLTMERWRWLPADLGAFYVWDNIPEYRTRVVDDGAVVHQAKIIVGKAETQTPLFSADMRYIVFHPDWGVPNSIKVKEILPYLRPTQSFFGYGETDTRVLQRHNLRVSQGGRLVDPARINWTQVDIRRYDFIQPPGASNVLGTVKFRFPNKHDVYMHDTSQRELFSRGTRTFSHGCVRVENPRRLAEILLARDKGWSADKVGQLLAGGAQNQSIELTTRIPVHITYATAVAGEDGQVTFHPDIYGHDNRLALALDGKTLPLEPIANTDTEVRREQVSRRTRTARPPPGPTDFLSALFGN